MSEHPSPYFRQEGDHSSFFSLSISYRGNYSGLIHTQTSNSKAANTMGPASTKKKKNERKKHQGTHQSIDTMDDKNSQPEPIKEEKNIPLTSELNDDGILPKSDQEALEQLLNILQSPEDILLPPLPDSASKSENSNNWQGMQTKLSNITQYLFTRMEKLAQDHENFVNKAEEKTEEKDDICPLSGMKDLYIPTEEDGSEKYNIMDMETVWGQVEIQNEALMKKINASLKTSKKNIKKEIQAPMLLDMEGMYSDDDESDKHEEDGDSDDIENQEENEDSTDDDDDDDDDDDEEEETRRIRERMERAMADMEEGSENNSDNQEDENDAENEENDSNDEENVQDPAADELNDGFFDINDMEAFADEEEDFHTFLNDDYNDDEDEDEQNKARKKYREDGVIDALNSMYNDSAKNDSDDDEEFEEEDKSDEDNEDDDIINMTAADFFGKPKARYFPNWAGHKNKNPNNSADKKKVQWKTEETEKGDDDSWNNYDFDHKDDNKGENDDWPTRDNDKEGEEEANYSNEEDDDEENIIAAPKTTFSKKQQKLDAQIKQLEEEILAEKPWQMKGETKSSSRPVNSLLESTPEFTMASKIAPTITIEHTNNLEDIIQARILAEDWDDVVPRELPDIFKNKRSNDLEDVSQEKSKLGLGELYEREFLKKAMGYDKDKVEKETAEDKAKNEMRELFANLCSKLDAMSNYHFAPRPVMEEADVREITTPAIAVEEIIPMHVSDQRGVAPEEVYDGGKKRGKHSVLKGESEMDQVRYSVISNIRKCSLTFYTHLCYFNTILN